MTVRYRFTNDGRRILVSKEEMRKKGVKSPNKADSLFMAITLVDKVKRDQDNYYVGRRQQPQGESLFQIAGIR